MKESNSSGKPAVDEKYVRPQKAERLMKNAQATRQTVYIYGATGYGKTSFAADFLSRKNYEYYTMAANESDIAEECALDKSRIIVIDDLYLLDSPEERERYYPVLERLAELSGVWLILISRCPIPAWLKPIYLRHTFMIIGEKDLSLTENEEKNVLAKWGLSLMPETAKKLRELGGGQPLSLRIGSMRLLQMDHYESSEERQKAELTEIESGIKDWWDFLETHVYDQWNVELQEFLMDISILERFDLRTAQLVTKKTDAARLIQQAQETGNFLLEYEEHGNIFYRLRDHMKLSMRKRLAKKCSQTHINELYNGAGNAYELQGDVLNALTMYEKCENEEGISRLLIENARKYVGVAHYWQLRRYYLTLSEETIKQKPELIMGMCILQSILLNDEESDRWHSEFEEYVKRQTGTAKKTAQARLLYLNITLPNRGIGEVTDIIKSAAALMTGRKTILPELSFTNNQPSMMNGGKDFCEWSKHDRELAASIGKIAELVFGKFGKGFVNLALAESAFEKGDDNYEVATLIGRGRLQAEGGGKLEQVFVAVGLMAWLSLINNHLEDALESLNSFRTSAAIDAPQLLTGIDTLKTRLNLYAGRSGDVSEWMAQAPDEDAEFCTLERYRYITKVRVYIATGRKEKALGLLERLIPYAQKRQRTFLYIEATILLAIVQFRIRWGGWQETLQEAITQAEDYHFVRILTREGKALWELLNAGDFTWQDADFKKQVLGECKYMAHNYPAYLDEKQDGNVLLTDKALQVLRLQAEGLSVDQIAKNMGLSKAGIKYYNQETYKKLGVSSKAAAITEARNRKLI